MGDEHWYPRVFLGRGVYMNGYFYSDNGEIVRIVQASTLEDIEIEFDGTNQFIVSDVQYDDSTHYVSNETILPRPTIPLSIIDSVISGIPKGTSLKLGDQTFTIDDGEADIEGYSGTVKLTCWPYLDAEVEI